MAGEEAVAGAGQGGGVHEAESLVEERSGADVGVAFETGGLGDGSAAPTRVTHEGPVKGLV
jgi:hypothetical protein